MSNALDIDFVYPLQDSNLTVRIKARVTLHHREAYYSIGDFFIEGRTEQVALPVLEIMLVNGLWLHRESGKETAVSASIGGAIERALVAAHKV
jgi:hypothetical protein